MIELQSILPVQGPTHGGTVAKILASGLGPGARVWFSDVPAQDLLVEADAIYVQVPAHAAGLVDISLESGTERATFQRAYRYLAPALAQESDLTRLVRALLQQLKRHVVRSTTLSVSVEYAGHASDDTPAASVASLPALVLSGPTLRENRLCSLNAGVEMQGPNGVHRNYAPPRTVDLEFGLLGASASTVELLNLMSATILFLHQANAVTLPRDARFPELGQIALPIQITGDARTFLDNREGVRSFSCDFAVRGFDLSIAQPRAAYGAAERAAIQLTKEPSL